MKKLSALNNKGMVMIMVIMVVMVLMILSASILSTSLNQSVSTQGQVDDIKAEQIAKGEFFKDQSSGVITLGSRPVIVDGKTYTVTVTQPGPPGTAYQYKVDY